jgi:hypothetical protein
LVQQALRQADIHTRDEHFRAQRFEFADPGEQPIVVFGVHNS